MAQFLIETHDEKKTKLLQQKLRQLDFVDSIKKIKQTNNQLTQASDNREDFFAMAGIWSERDISIDTIRQQAWPNRAS